MFYRESDELFGIRLETANSNGLQILEYAYKHIITRLFDPYYDESYYRDRYELHDKAVSRLRQIEERKLVVSAYMQIVEEGKVVAS